MRDSKTNVVFILSDDQGYWAAGCYGNPEIRTPNIDRLATDGMLFERFFVAIPVCSPSRATFLTGRIPSQHGVHDWIRVGNMGADATPYLNAEVCYTDILAEHGWTCGLSGKWHLGASQLSQHGFSHWYAHQQGSGPYYNAPMVRNGLPVREPEYVSDLITDDALAFIGRQQAAGQPFYVSVHYTAPHFPWDNHPPQVVASYADCRFTSCPQEPIHPWAKELTRRCMGNRDMLKGYFAAVTAMDVNIGRILDDLERRGLRQNTLVIFTSDNGYSLGQHGFWGKGNGTQPPNMYEASIRVPFIASQPGRIPCGQRQNVLVSAYDFAPTLLDYLGLPALPGDSIAGRSFLSCLMGETPTARDHVVVYDEYGGTRMIRTGEWKYVMRSPDGPDELWDMMNDPDERCNLVTDASRATLVRQLRRELVDWFARHVDCEVDGSKQDVKGFGQLRPLQGAWKDRGHAFLQEYEPERY